MASGRHDSAAIQHDVRVLLVGRVAQVSHLHDRRPILRRSNDPWAEPSRGSGRSIGRWGGLGRCHADRGVRRGKGELGTEIELSPNYFYHSSQRHVDEN